MKILRWYSKNKRTTYILAVGIALLSLAGIFFYQAKYLKPSYITVRIKGSPGNWWWVTPRPPDWLASAVKVGDKEFNAMNKSIAEITSVDVYDAGGPTKDVYLTAKLDVRYNAQTKKYRYKGEPLEIGGPITLSLGSTFFPGMVVSIAGVSNTPQPYKDITVEVQYKDRWPYEYAAITVGDTIKDGQGIVIAEVLKKERTPAEREAYTSSGEVLRRLSPVLDNFYVTVKLKVRDRDELTVWREEQYIKIGNQLWMLFPHYNISGAFITSIH